MTPHVRPPTIALHELESAGQELGQIARNLGLTDLAGDISNELRRRLSASTFRVMVLGEVKHGKSSLINALLRQRLLPVGVVPTTARLVSVRVGENMARYAVTADDSRIPVDEADFVALVTGRGELSNQKLKPTTTLAELTCESTDFSRGLELYDTPGFNDVDHLRALVTRAAIPQADLVLLVLDATQALSQSEVDLVRRSLEALGGIEKPEHQLVIAINRADLIPESAHDDVRDRVSSLLDELGAHAAPIYMTNARAWQDDREEQSGFQLAALREHLMHLAGQRGSILPERARRSLGLHCRNLEQAVGFQLQGLIHDRSTLESDIAAIKSEIASRKQDFALVTREISSAHHDLAKKLDDNFAEFREKMLDELRELTQRADLDQLTHLLPGAVRDLMMRLTIHQCAAMQKDLDALTRRLLSTHGALLERRLEQLRVIQQFQHPILFIPPQSIGIELSSLLLGIVGTAVMYFGRTMPGLIMTIAAPLANVVLREKAVRQARAEVLSALPEHLDRGLSLIKSGLLREARRYTDELEQFLSIQDERLATTLIQSLSRALQIKQDQRTGNSEQEIARLEQCLGRLETLRPKLIVDTPVHLH